MYKSNAKRIKVASAVTPFTTYDTINENKSLVNLCKENFRLLTDVVKLGEICF